MLSRDYFFNELKLAKDLVFTSVNEESHYTDSELKKIFQDNLDSLRSHTLYSGVSFRKKDATIIRSSLLDTQEKPRSVFANMMRVYGMENFVAKLQPILVETINVLHAAKKSGKLQTKVYSTWEEYKLNEPFLSFEEFGKPHIQSGVTNFQQLFAGSKEREVARGVRSLTMLAAELDSKYSIAHNEVKDFFSEGKVIQYEIPSIRYPSPEEVAPVNRLTETTLLDYSDQVEEIKDRYQKVSSYLDWSANSKFGNDSEVFRDFLEYRKASGFKTLASCFDGVEDRMALSKNLRKYKKSFGNYFRDYVKLLEETETTSRVASTESMESSEGYAPKTKDVMSFKDKFVEMALKKDYNGLVSFIEKNKIHSSAVIKLCNMLKATHPKTKSFCNAILENLGVFCCDTKI